MIRVVLSFCLSMVFVAAYAQLNTPLQQAQVDVVYLASDYLEGRETGLKGEQLAAEYIAWRFSQMGLQPKEVETQRLPAHKNYKLETGRIKSSGEIFSEIFVLFRRHSRMLLFSVFGGALFQHN